MCRRALTVRIDFVASPPVLEADRTRGKAIVYRQPRGYISCDQRQFFLSTQTRCSLSRLTTAVRLKPRLVSSLASKAAEAGAVLTGWPAKNTDIMRTRCRVHFKFSSLHRASPKDLSASVSAKSFRKNRLFQPRHGSLIIIHIHLQLPAEPPPPQGLAKFFQLSPSSHWPQTHCAICSICVTHSRRGPKRAIATDTIVWLDRSKIQKLAVVSV